MNEETTKMSSEIQKVDKPFVKSKRRSPISSYLAISICWFVLFSVGYVYFYNVVLGQTEIVKKTLADLAKERYSKDHQQAIDKLLEDTKVERKEITQLFVKSDQVVSFIEDLEKVGTSVGADVTISSINADDATVLGDIGVGSIRTHVEAKGSWSAILKILILTENMPYAITIDKLRIESMSIVVDGTASAVNNAKATAWAPAWKIGFDVRALMVK